MNDKIPDSCHDDAFTCFEYELAHVWESFPTTSEGFENSSCCMIEYWPKMILIMIDKYLFETLGLQRKCRVHKDCMIMPYLMDNWFIF